MDLSKFPGTMYYRYGLEAIHADWLIYPNGHGYDVALLNFAYFQRGTVFYEIDDIDRCKLFIIIDPDKITDPFNYNNYHIAIWHEDLIELKNKGLIEGVYECSDYEFQLIQFERIKEIIGKHTKVKMDKEGNIILSLKNGKESLYKRPKKEEIDDEFSSDDCAHIPDKRVQLNDNAFLELMNITKNYKLSDEILSRVEPLLNINYFDTAIREASLIVETKLKKFHNKTLFGQKLVDHHINYLKKENDDFLSAYLKCYRGELRAVFKYLRNDFVHNFIIIDKFQCIALLSRINEVLISVNDIIEKDKNR